ncbi:MAG: S41 family peptidase [Acidobacteriia bacterium]|nr:S41 family peptidase [Terriglobia bacterium]
MLPQRAIVHVTLLVTSLLAFAPLLAAQSTIPTDGVTQETLRLTRLYGVIADNSMDPLDPDRAIFDGAIRGMLAALDPFSSFFDPDQFEQLKQFTQGKTRGFGSVLYVQPGKILVLQTAEGSPSRRAGLGPGDEIVSLNGKRTDGLDLQSLVDLLQRARSQAARLGVIRPGSVVAQDFELHPAEIPTPSVDKVFLLKPGFAYVHLNSFDIKTPQEVSEAIQNLGGTGLQGLLLDLRDNRGGVVDSAVALASLFLKPDLLVYTQRGRSVPEKSFRTSVGPVHFDFPLVVLVNGATASAAEVFAAALQEHDRALIAGEPTYGKGVVESVTPLSGNTGLALTTAQYFTPCGRSIQRPMPGTALENPDKGLAPSRDPALAFKTDSGRAVVAGGGITPDVMLPSVTRDPWVTFLNQSGLFTTFASQYLTLHGKITESFEPDAQVLAQFREYLEQGRVRVPDEYWGPDQDYLKLRIKVELFDLVFGLAVGDEVEARGDPQVQSASTLFPEIPLLLKPAAASAPSLKQKGK